MDVDKYLQRINYTGLKEASINSLKELVFAHNNYVPFDTLDMFGGERKILDLEKIYTNIVINHRGGFCFELNGLFCWLLENLGYNVVRLYARTLQTGLQEFTTYNDHMVLMVTIDDVNWLVDVGWGGNSMVYPIPICDMKTEEQTHGTFRIRRAKVDKEDCYIFEKQLQKVLDVKGNVIKEKDQKPVGKYETAGWKLFYKFKTVPHEIQDFKSDFEIAVNEHEFLLKNPLFILHTKKGWKGICGNKLLSREYANPVTIIAEDKEIQNSEEFIKVVKEFDPDIKMSFVPTFKKTNFVYT